MRQCSLIIGTSVALFTGQATAQVFYFDRPSFNAAVSGLFFESFENNPQAGASVVYGDLTFTETNGTNFITHTAINSFFTAATTDGSHSIWFDDNNDSVAVINIAFPINAIGFDVATSSGATITVGGPFGTNFAVSANTPQFFGVINPAAFTSFTVEASGGPEVGFDAVSYGIPAPGAAALLGLGGLMVLRRRA